MRINFKPNAWVGAFVFVGATAYFLFARQGIAQEPFFDDEAAIIGQTYFFRLASKGDFSHPDWVSHAAYDHQPLYKYAIGAALAATGRSQAIPDSLDDWKKWMSGIHKPAASEALSTARGLMAAGAGLACLFVYLFVARLQGPPAGLLAAVIFASSPLVFTHARRAMIDVSSQGFSIAVLAGAAAFVGAATHRGRWLYAAAVIILGALGPLAKWNAAIGCMTVIIVALIGLVIGPWSVRRPSMVLIGCVAAAVGLFVVCDPYYWAKPDSIRLSTAAQQTPPNQRAELYSLASSDVLSRANHALKYRRDSLANAQAVFPNDFLTMAERLPAIVIQGMGRWSLNNRAYTVSEAERPRAERTLPEDLVRAALIGVWTLVGLSASVRMGFRQRLLGQFPVAWLLPIWASMDAMLLVGNLTLDWDRYYLSTVAWSSAAAAVGVSATVRASVRAMRLPAKELKSA